VHRESRVSHAEVGRSARHDVVSQGRIIALGSINVDFEVRAERWPAPGTTLLGRDFLMAGGGKGGNVAYLARRLGVGTRLIGHVGDDVLCEQALRSLRDAGVDLHSTKVVAGCPTGVAMIVVRPDGEKAIVAAGNANDTWTAADAHDAAVTVAADPPGSVLVADLEVPAFVTQQVVEAARRRNLRTVLNPSRPERMPDSLYPLIDYMTPNPFEARQLTGIAVESVDAAFRAGQVLVDRGVSTALVKLARGGCVVVTKDRRDYIPTVPVRAIDTTGAGDAFAGALSVALLEERPVLEAARFAVAAATLSVQKYGAQPSYPTRSELEHALAHQRQARA
jgi:ribokinase